ncbi:MAG: hypothetical protein Q9164_001108 [Protoblastenia rupestris]
MNQENRYPSPEPTNAAHPYHSGQHQLSSDPGQHLQHAPTAMMHDQGGDGNGMAQSMQYIAQYGPAQPSTPQQLAQQGLDVDGQNTDPMAKKKTKVSRACDECRRKKVRCDAETDQPGVQCANCKRASTTCEFSRQPQKRGPSKGYIKELAERVSRLEYPGATSPDMQYAPMSHGLPQAEQPTYSPHVEFNAPNPRKRTHSVAEGPQQYIQGQDQLQEYSRGSTHIPNMTYPSASNAVMQAPVYDLPGQTGGAVSGLNQGDLEGYFGRIHITLPLLPESHHELQSILERVTPSVREAFQEAMSLAVKAGHSNINDSQARSAANLCLAIKTRRANEPNLVQHLIHLQALIFMAIADELNSPASSRKATWLGSAVTLANSLQLQRLKHTETTGISLALGHLCNAFLHHEYDISEKRPSGRVMIELMRGEVQRIEESIEPILLRMPLVHLAFLHIKILQDKAAEAFYSSDTPVIDAALRTVNILRSDQYHSSPLEHHFAGLAAGALAVAHDLEPAPIAESLNHLRQVCDSNRLPPAWSLSISAYISSQLEAHRSKAANSDADARRGGLLHLADAAMGANHTASQERIDWTSITSKGYLRAFE